MRWICLVLAVWLTACTSSMEERANSVDDPLGAAKTRLSLGLTYLQSGNYTQAKFNLDRALQFAPRFADAHYGLAYYYQQVGEVEKAKTSYDTALGLSPNDPEIINSYGVFLCTLREHDTAEQLFLKAVNTQNYLATAETYENAAICQQSAGNVEKSELYLKKALNHQPRRGKSLFLLAKIQYDLKKFIEAKANLARYEAVDGLSADSTFLRLQIAEALNDVALIQQTRRTLNERFPQHPMAKKVALDDDAGLVTPITSAPAPSSNVSTGNTNATIANTAIDDENRKIHFLQKGETLFRLSKLYGVTVQDIIQWNNLFDVRDLAVGQAIIVSRPIQ